MTTHNTIRRFTFAAIAALMLPLSVAHAQAVPSLVEGPIVAVADDSAGGAWITVVNITVHVPAGVFASGSATSPTATLSQAQLLDDTPLPGRTEPGFVGGTAIINGTSTVGGDFVADDLFVEAAENVVIGIVTANDACALKLEGVPLVKVADTRMPFGQAINGGGFEVDYCAMPVNGSAAIEGYFANGSIHIFSFESDDAPVVSTAGVVNITRANCSGNRLEVRGSTSATTGEVTVSDADEGTVFGTESIIIDTVTNTGTYRFRQNVGACPTNVRVDNLADGSFSIAPIN